VRPRIVVGSSAITTPPMSFGRLSADRFIVLWAAGLVNVARKADSVYHRHIEPPRRAGLNSLP
jgi:hypothetical protein